MTISKVSQELSEDSSSSQLSSHCLSLPLDFLSGDLLLRSEDNFADFLHPARELIILEDSGGAGVVMVRLAGVSPSDNKGSAPLSGLSLTESSD